MAAGHAEVRAELASIQKALEGYAAANSVEPPAWMKGRILERIEQEAVPPAPSAPSKPVVLQLLQLLALGFALLAGFFFFQKNNLNSEKKALETRVAELQQQINDCNQRGQSVEKLQQANVFLRNRNTRNVPLSNATGGAGMAYLNSDSCKVAIDLTSLPAPPPGKYYQFWSIVHDKPVNMGMVDLRAVGGWQFIPCQENAVALAISLEDNPNGNPAPTQVFLVGNIPAG